MRFVLCMVLDAVGLDTLNYLFDRYQGDVHLPNLAQFGLGQLLAERHRSRIGTKQKLSGNFSALLQQASMSADSVIGHCEMTGIINDHPYEVLPNGVPRDYLDALEVCTGRRYIFNQMVGGMTAIIQNADEHRRTGNPIIYTSICDPAIQIAMDEEVIPIAEQHSIVGAALKLAIEMKLPVNRVISRPYRSLDGGEYKRTANRHDVVLPVTVPTLIDILRKRNVWTVAIGKVSDLVPVKFDEVVKITDIIWLDQNFDYHFVHPQKKDTNPLNVQGIINAQAQALATFRPRGTFVFANLVDTDSLWGHAKPVDNLHILDALVEFDRHLGYLTRRLSCDDLLIITADHGMEFRNNYGYHHSEPVPMLLNRDKHYLQRCQSRGLTAIGMLVAEYFGCAEEFKSIITHIG